MLSKFLAQSPRQQKTAITAVFLLSTATDKTEHRNSNGK